MKRSVLNVASTKKRDSMAIAYRPFNNAGIKNGTIEEIEISAANGNSYFLWCMTGRYYSQDDSPNMIAQRTKKNTYAVGLKERMLFKTSDGNPWYWRRIVFSMYGTSAFAVDPSSNTIDFPTVFSTGPNYQRGFVSMGSDSVATAEMIVARNNIRERVFRGVAGTDWLDYLTAPTNTGRVKIVYDKLTRIDSGNDEGGYKVAKRWHPVHKRLEYADYESGRDEFGVEWSSENRKSCGDYYIMDIFAPFTDAEGVSLTIRCDATYYWHER